MKQIVQEGQHPLTGQRAPPISGGTQRRRRTLIDGYLESVSDCMSTVIKMELSRKTVYGPVLTTMQQNHASPERCRKSFTMIFLGDHDIRLTGSNFGNDSI